MVKNIEKMAKKSKKRKVCKLKPSEDKAWEKAYVFYLDEGESDSKAGKLAFKDLVTEFPRLKGCKEIK